jgi:phosphoglycolate phosphatase
MPRAVVFFDLDGVLVDSRRGITDCMNRVLSERSLATYDPGDLERVIGPPSQESFATLLAERGGDLAWVPQCVARYRELYATAAIDGGTELQPGIVALLDALSQRFVLAVATSKPLSFAEPILASLGIRDAFRSVTGPTPETDGETKSETLRRAIDSTGDVNVRQSWMIGDRYHDVRAAIDNGVAPIGVTWGFGSERELCDAGATKIAHDTRELLDFLISASAAP